MKVLFENGQVRVSVNSSGEVFVETLTNGEERNSVRIRVTDTPFGFRITSDNGVLTPWAINGLPAFEVKPRR